MSTIGIFGTCILQMSMHLLKILGSLEATIQVMALQVTKHNHLQLKY